jgi:soluble lytic murein transglycosylase-like protein
MLLCSIGYVTELFRDVAKDYDIKYGFYLYTDTQTSVENKNKIITSDKNKEDISYNKSNISNKPIQSSYQRIIYSKADKYRIEPSLVSAVIKVESNWDAKAISHKGAMGLMQLMPSTAKEMNIKNPFDPEENIEGGTRYLRYLLDKFDGDINLALAAYNAGPGKIEKFRGIPPFKETKQYVKRILSIYNGERLNL